MEETTRKIVVTGASGTLGYNIVRLLSSDSRNEIFLPLRNPQPSLFEGSAHIHPFYLDYSDVAHLKDVLTSLEPSTIVHCAASGLRPPKTAWFEMVGFNVEATLRLFQASCALKDCHFIYISTGLVYQQQGRPLNESDPTGTLHPYGASKAAADSLLQAAAAEFGRRLTVFRPFSFTGLHDGGTRIFPSLLRAAVTHQPFDLSPGGQVRDFCPAQDIASAVMASFDQTNGDLMEIFNVGSGSSATLKETVQRVCQELALDVELRFGTRPYHPWEAMHLVADISKAVSLLGWEPRVNLAFAVWELARSEFPDLNIRRPKVRNDFTSLGTAAQHHIAGL